MDTQHFNFFQALQPGIYGIICNKTNKIYIGESRNILDRFAKHSRNLEKGISDCAPLQKDWNLYGPSEFAAIIICSGPQFSILKDRLDKETEIIASYEPDPASAALSSSL